MFLVLHTAWRHRLIWRKIIPVAIFNKYKPFFVDVHMLVKVVIETVGLDETTNPVETILLVRFR